MPATIPAGQSIAVDLRLSSAKSKKDRIEVRAETSVGAISLPLGVWVFPAIALSPPNHGVDLLAGASRTVSFEVDQCWTASDPEPAAPKIEAFPAGAVQLTTAPSERHDLGEGYLRRSTSVSVRIDKPSGDGAVALRVLDAADGTLLDEGKLSWSVRDHAYLVPPKLYLGPGGAKAVLVSGNPEAEIVGIRSQPGGVSCRLLGPREILVTNAPNGDVDDRGGVIVLELRGGPKKTVEVGVRRTGP